MSAAQDRYIEEITQLAGVKEIKRRARVMAELADDSSVATFEENYNGKGADRYFWNDGAGNEGNIIFQADNTNEDSILIYAYSADSIYNTYGKKPTKPFVFDGIPQSLEHLLSDDKLQWSWDKKKPKFLYGTAAVWHEHQAPTWGFSKTLWEQLATNNDDGGLIYTFRWFMAGFSLDELKGKLEYWPSGEIDASHVEKVYAKYYPEASSQSYILKRRYPKSFQPKFQNGKIFQS